MNVIYTINEGAFSTRLVSIERFTETKAEFEIADLYAIVLSSKFEHRLSNELKKAFVKSPK